MRGFDVLAALYLIADRLRPVELSHDRRRDLADERIACEAFVSTQAWNSVLCRAPPVDDSPFDLYLSAADAFPRDDVSLLRRAFPARRTVFGSHVRPAGIPAFLRRRRGAWARHSRDCGEGCGRASVIRCGARRVKSDIDAALASGERRRILFVGMHTSIHVARWLRMVQLIGFHVAALSGIRPGRRASRGSEIYLALRDLALFLGSPASGSCVRAISTGLGDALMSIASMHTGAGRTASWATRRWQRRVVWWSASNASRHRLSHSDGGAARRLPVSEDRAACGAFALDIVELGQRHCAFPKAGRPSRAHL